MAVTTTPRQILNAAYARSAKNQPGQIATEATELLGFVIRTFRLLYAMAARVNPAFFGAEKSGLTYASPGWARPEDAELVWRIEKADGTRVLVVPFDDRQIDTYQPAVYRFGQIYRPAHTDPSSQDTLTFFYSKRPADPPDLDTPVDALWTEQFNELPILEVAIYLALKDGRTEEAEELKPERDRWLQLFLAFLEHETVGEVRRFAPAFHGPSVAPLQALLIGGGA